MKFFTSALVLSMAFILQEATAQPGLSLPDDKEINEIHKHPGELPYVTTNESRDARKGTTVRQRLTNESVYELLNASLVRFDTLTYKYSSNRGSVFNPHTLQYNYKIRNEYVSGDYRDITTVSIMADFITSRSYDGYEYHYVRTFTPDNKILSDDLRHGTMSSFDNYRYRHTYNSNGYISSRMTYKLNATTNQWDSIYKRNLTYTASGLILSDSDYRFITGWQLQATTRYTHNAQGNILSLLYSNKSGLMWRDYSRSTYTYDASGNKIISRKTDYTNGSQLANYFLDSFEYAGALPSYTKMISYTWQASPLVWKRTNRQEKKYNNISLTDTVLNYDWDTTAAVWASNTWSVYEYNTYDNPVKATTFNATGTAIKRNNYYYELYNDAATAVMPQSKKLVATVYPNPAVVQLYINLPDSKNMPVAIRITDISGRLLYMEQLLWVNATESFNIGQLSPGIYLLHISTPDGVMQQTFTKK